MPYGHARPRLLIRASPVRQFPVGHLFMCRGPPTVRASERCFDPPLPAGRLSIATWPRCQPRPPPEQTDASCQPVTVPHLDNTPSPPPHCPPPQTKAAAPPPPPPPPEHGLHHSLHHRRSHGCHHTDAGGAAAGLAVCPLSPFPSRWPARLPSHGGRGGRLPPRLLCAPWRAPGVFRRRCRPHSRLPAAAAGAPPRRGRRCCCHRGHHHCRRRCRRHRHRAEVAAPLIRRAVRHHQCCLRHPPLPRRARALPPAPCGGDAPGG